MVELVKATAVAGLKRPGKPALKHVIKFKLSKLEPRPDYAQVVIAYIPYLVWRDDPKVLGGAPHSPSPSPCRVYSTLCWPNDEYCVGGWRSYDSSWRVDIDVLPLDYSFSPRMIAQMMDLGAFREVVATMEAQFHGGVAALYKGEGVGRSLSSPR